MPCGVQVVRFRKNVFVQPPQMVVEGTVSCAGKTLGAGQPVERVLVGHFPQMVNDQQTDIAAVGHFFQGGGIPVVDAIALLEKAWGIF